MNLVLNSLESFDVIQVPPIHFLACKNHLSTEVKGTMKDIPFLWPSISLKGKARRLHGKPWRPQVITDDVANFISGTVYPVTCLRIPCPSQWDRLVEVPPRLQGSRQSWTYQWLTSPGRNVRKESEWSQKGELKYSYLLLIRPVY